MSIFPRKPKHGDKVLQSIYDAVCQIIDYLPSLQVRGDDKTIRVNSFSYGKTIESISKNTSTASAPTSGGTIVIDEGAAVPAIVQAQPNGFGLPYNITIYPDGYDKSSYQAEYALPTALSFSNIPPNGSKIIVFKTYVNALAGDEEYEGDIE